MPTAITRSVATLQNLDAAYAGNFRHGSLDTEGKFQQAGAVAGWRGRWVSKVESGSVREGSLRGKVIRAVVGGERFNSIFNTLRRNRETSLEHASRILAESMPQGLQADYRRRFRNELAVSNAKVRYARVSEMLPELVRTRRAAGRGDVRRPVAADAARPATRAQYHPQSTLQGEINEGKRLGYLKEVVQKKGASGPSNPEFKYIVSHFNGTMADLHGRFPRLAGVKPPALSSHELLGSCSPAAVGTYYRDVRTLWLSSRPDRYWQRIRPASLASGYGSPKAAGIDGAITHEYAHHLSLSAVKPKKWYPRLVQVLQDNGVMDRTPPHPRFQDAEKFRAAIKDNCRSAGLGRYAATDPTEFAAEALAWYMAPDYGSRETPHMPAYLENWLLESFPFLHR